jgi:low temperature requirement protein LtrA
VSDPRISSLLRTRTGKEQVTNVELFFDLVYVFAITQLSNHLLALPTPMGALQTVVLFAMVWLAWAYTTWLTNWLDPGMLPVRVMLLCLTLVGLVMSAAIPEAFMTQGLTVGASYALMQVGRSIFALVALRGDRLQRNYWRILSWCCASGTLAVAGGLVSGHARLGLWMGAVAVDVLGAAMGFRTPGLGRSTTEDWTIEGGHFAERCQAFILIALGESIVVIGATLSRLPSVTVDGVAAFGAAFLGCIGLWWLYFDRSAEEGAAIIARSSDPGRLGRSAYHMIHPIMVAGIVVTAAADQQVLSSPRAVGVDSTSWLILGGTALFIAGHAAFKWAVWRVIPWTRLGAIVALAALFGLLAPHVTALALAGCTTVVIVAIAAIDRWIEPVRVY